MSLPWRYHRRPYSGSLNPTVLGILVILAGFSLAFVLRSHHAAESKQAAQTAEPLPSLRDRTSAGRKIFPLSVIHGGAYSAQELSRARRTDSVVAAHYSGFGPSPRFQKLEKSTLMYVSYRRGNQIYWSKTKHQIARGETVISDGNCLARARCGNRLSATPQKPVAPAEPTEEVLNTPEAPDEPISYKLVDLPGPAGRSFDMGLPAGVLENGLAPAGALASSGVAPAAASSVPAGYFGSGSGAGPLASGGPGRPTAPSGAAPAVATPGASTLPVTTTGGSSLPTSSGFPADTSITGGVPVDIPAELVPEPSTAGYSLLLLSLGGVALVGRARARFLRRQIR